MYVCVAPRWSPSPWRSVWSFTTRTRNTSRSDATGRWPTARQSLSRAGPQRRRWTTRSVTCLISALQKQTCFCHWRKAGYFRELVLHRGNQNPDVKQNKPQDRKHWFKMILPRVKQFTCVSSSSQRGLMDRVSGVNLVRNEQNERDCLTAGWYRHKRENSSTDKHP